MCVDVVSDAQPGRAKCHHCDLELIEPLVQRDSRCPRCHVLLNPELRMPPWREVGEAECSDQKLVRSLRRLEGPPGTTSILPHSVLDAFWEEVGWEGSLANVHGRVAGQVRERLYPAPGTSPRSPGAFRGACENSKSVTHRLRSRPRSTWRSCRRSTGR
jgi:hypothetical protein